jgi:hypothetical protein
VNPALLSAAAAVIDGEIRNISLSDYRGKYVVLFWCVIASISCVAAVVALVSTRASRIGILENSSATS